MARATLLLLVALAGGCYRSHEGGVSPDSGLVRRDGGQDAGARDAGTRDARVGRADAGRQGVFWTLEPRPARVFFPHSLGCTQFAGGSVAIQAVTRIMNDCEHAGPVEIRERADGTFVVHAFVWLEHRLRPDACPGITAVMDRTVLVAARAGPARAEDALGSSGDTIMVAHADDAPCTGAIEHGGPCVRDCDCRSGLRCVPDLGDFAECFGGRCGDPCNPLALGVAPVYPRNFDCPLAHECVATGGASAVCELSADLCSDHADCGPGLVCPLRDRMDCEWQVELRAATRHACVGDDDCEPGMHCVEHGDGRRRCEVPCFTSEMRCPAMHACAAHAGWVCEWLGE